MIAIPLQKIVATGAPGVEWGALDAAVALGLATGGVCPLGYRTALGPQPELLQGWGLEELDGDFGAALCENIWEADVTVRMCRNALYSDVSRVDDICAGWAKPFHDVHLDLWEGYPTAKPLEQMKLREFLAGWEAKTVCVCGQISASYAGAQRLALGVQTLILEALR